MTVLKGRVIKEIPTKNRRVRTIAIDELTMAHPSGADRDGAGAARLVRVAVVADAFVFSDSPDGSQPWKPDAVSRFFARLRKRVDLDHLDFHYLRKFMETYGQEMGFSVSQVAMRAGHDPAIAAKHYSGRVSETDRALATAVASLLVDGEHDPSGLRLQLDSEAGLADGRRVARAGAGRGGRRQSGRRWWGRRSSRFGGGRGGEARRLPWTWRPVRLLRRWPIAASGRGFGHLFELFRACAVAVPLVEACGCGSGWSRCCRGLPVPGCGVLGGLGDGVGVSTSSEGALVGMVRGGDVAPARRAPRRPLRSRL